MTEYTTPPLSDDILSSSHSVSYYDWKDNEEGTQAFHSVWTWSRSEHNYAMNLLLTKDEGADVNECYWIVPGTLDPSVD